LLHSRSLLIKYPMDKKVYEFISKQIKDPIAERRDCVVSWKSFAIFQGDLDFYHKIWPTFNGKKYPCLAPVMEPHERSIHRLSFRNNKKLYRRNCDLTGKNIISEHPADSPYKVYHQDDWYTDSRDPTTYGQEIDWNKSFFEQFENLLLKVPKMALVNVNSENSQYANYVSNAKNCYMTSVSYHNSEDIYYSCRVMSSNNCCDCYHLENCERCIGCTDGWNLQSCYYTHICNDSRFCYFSAFLENCSDCIFCNNLVNKQYYIFNKQYTKEQYNEYIKKLKADPEFFTKWFTKFKEILQSAIYPAVKIIRSENSYWSNIYDNKNTLFCVGLSEWEDCRYSGWEYTKDIRDVSGGKIEMWLESINVGLEWTYHLIGCKSIISCSNMYYCDNCYDNCEYCFGCVGLRWKKYYIFNKQYSKEDREREVSILAEKMTKEWVRWHFFPRKLTAFAYNDTWAYEIAELTKEEAIDKWFKRKDEEFKKYDWEWVECEKSGRGFRHISLELKLYSSLWVPAPKIHPDERHRELYKRRAWEKFHLISCSKCKTKTLSVYPQDSGLKIYCPDCYNKEIY